MQIKCEKQGFYMEGLSTVTRPIPFKHKISVPKKFFSIFVSCERWLNVQRAIFHKNIFSVGVIQLKFATLKGKN